MNAATVTLKIRYVVHPLDRPRFEPSPALRRLGFKGRDLKHPDGRWFDILECQKYVDGLLAEIATRRQRQAEGKRLKPLSPQNLYSVAQLFADLFQEPRFQAAATVRVKTLSPATVRNYKTMANALLGFDEELWMAPVASVSTVVAWGLYEKLHAAKGLHMARHVIATCRMAWSWARKKGRAHGNPFMDLGMETPKGRTRAASVAELRHFIAICDQNGRPEIGDMLMLGLVTGQRQADRLALEGGQVEGGRFRFLQRKTGKRISGPVVPALAARLDGARARRRDDKVQWPQVVIDEEANQPFKADHYRHVFSVMRGRAALTMPSLADLRDQDLRDTAITWARAGGAGFEERRKLSGHSQQSAALEEKHYLAEAESEGDEAVAAIMSVWEGEL